MTTQAIISDKRIHIRNITFAALFLALSLLLPFLTGQIPQIGSLVSPMHIPAFLCGYVCGPVWGAIVGFVSPLLRFVLFGMPPIFPIGIAMSVELAAYGVISGLLYRIFPKKPSFLYLSLIISMIGGRLIYSAFDMILLGLSGESFTPWLIILNTVTGTWVGIIVHLAIIPPLVMLIDRFVLRKNT